MLLIKNKRKREATLKNEAGGDEKHLFLFTWPNWLNGIGDFRIPLGLSFKASLRAEVFAMNTSFHSY